jgi:hypothetical protein
MSAKLQVSLARASIISISLLSLITQPGPWDQR